MMGYLSLSCGGIVSTRRPILSLFISTFFWPRYTCVSMGSRRGSMEGFVTCEAFTRILLKYMG